MCYNVLFFWNKTDPSWASVARDCHSKIIIRYCITMACRHLTPLSFCLYVLPWFPFSKSYFSVMLGNNSPSVVQWLLMYMYFGLWVILFTWVAPLYSVGLTCMPKNLRMLMSIKNIIWACNGWQAVVVLFLVSLRTHLCCLQWQLLGALVRKA